MGKHQISTNLYVILDLSDLPLSFPFFLLHFLLHFAQFLESVERSTNLSFLIQETGCLLYLHKQALQILQLFHLHFVKLAPGHRRSLLQHQGHGQTFSNPHPQMFPFAPISLFPLAVCPISFHTLSIRVNSCICFYLYVFLIYQTVKSHRL